MNESSPINKIVGLVGEVESLENENRALGVTLGDLEITLAKKKRAAKSLFLNSEKQRQRLLAFIAEENDLFREIEFYESEKNDHGHNSIRYLIEICRQSVGSRGHDQKRWISKRRDRCTGVANGHA